MKYVMIIFLLISQFVFSQERLSYQQAHADIDYYFKMIDSIHPNMYWHTPRTTIDSFKFALKERIQDSIDIREFSFFLTQGSHFFDYHTGHCDIGNSFYIEKCDSIFPIIEVKAGEVFLKDEGYRILTINDYTIHEIMSCVMNNFGADYPLETIYLFVNMTLVFQNTLSYMDIYPPYRVKVNSENKDFILNVNRMDMWEAAAYATDRLDEFWDYGKPYYFAIYPDSSVAIIYFNKCVTGEKEEIKLGRFLQSCFEQIKEHNIAYLFIDNSRNAGGDSSAADQFLSFLQIDRSVRTVYKWKEKVITKKGQWKMKTVRDPLKLPAVKGFEGKVFVYQSSETHSAGPHLCKLLKILRIGESFGTNTERVVYNYSNILSFRLPHSCLSCRVSTRYFLPNKGRNFDTNENGEIEPDIPYPLLIDRRLDVEDCMKIIELYPGCRN